MKRKRTFAVVLALILCLGGNLCFAEESFAAVVDGNEIESNRWYREDVVTVTSGEIYSEVYDRKVVYEETKTEVYHVYIGNGRRELQYTRYDVVWTGYRYNSVTEEWDPHPLYTNQVMNDVERNYIIEILQMMGFDGNAGRP